MQGDEAVPVQLEADHTAPDLISLGVPLTIVCVEKYDVCNPDRNGTVPTASILTGWSTHA